MVQPLTFVLFTLCNCILLIHLTETASVPPNFPILITAQLANSSNWQNLFIVGGTPVQYATDYPFMGAYLDYGFQFCGGSLISEDWVLTAAHCVGSQYPTGEVISLGSLRYDGAGNPAAEHYTVERAIRHPSYNPSTLSNDAGLLKLSSPVTFSDTVQPVRLAPRTSSNWAGRQATVTGWGVTDSGSASSILREVTYPIITNQQCSTMYSGITASMLCAYEPGKDSCQGDSGGPFFLDHEGTVFQVGIVSWGVGCAGVGAPGVYARVSQIVDWVCSETGVGC